MLACYTADDQLSDNDSLIKLQHYFFICFKRTVSDMTQQLYKEKATIVGLHEELATQQNIASSLQDQIKMLEQQLAAEEASCKEAKVKILFKYP